MLLLFLVSLSFFSWEFTLYYNSRQHQYSWILNEFTTVRNWYKSQNQRNFSDFSLNFRTLDCHRKKNRCSRRVSGVPAIYLKKKLVFPIMKTRYTETFDAESMVSFLRKHINDSLFSDAYIQLLPQLNKTSLDHIYKEGKCSVCANIHQQYGEKFRSTARYYKNDPSLVFFTCGKEIVADNNISGKFANLEYNNIKVVINLSCPLMDIAQAINNTCSFYRSGFQFKQLTVDLIKKWTKLKNITAYLTNPKIHSTNDNLIFTQATASSNNHFSNATLGL